MGAVTEFLATYFDEVEPLDFYRQIFPGGELQKRGVYQKGVYNGILIAVSQQKNNDGSTRIRRYTVTDDLDAIRQACASDDFCLMSPISYAGKDRSSANARFLYAIAVDLDRIKFKDRVPIGMHALVERHIDGMKRIPKPTFIVGSGTGAHLYYVLDCPIALYDDTVKQLQTFKHELTRLIWHDTVCDVNSAKEIQQEGIFQGFRIPGTITKVGDRARVFRYGDPVTMEYLNSFVDEQYRVNEFTVKRGLTLTEAKTKYPEWYDRRVIRKEPRGVWHVSRNVYEWWKRQILSGATVGHRYYCMMILAMYARKCCMYDPKHNPQPVTRQQLEKDAWELMDYMESLTASEDNHFTTDDVMKALEAFDDRWITYPRKAIEYRSGIAVPQTKRNHRTKSQHIKIMNFIRDEINGNKHWQGRKSAQDIVVQWRKENPDKGVQQCMSDTGLSKSTVYKWWNSDQNA